MSEHLQIYCINWVTTSYEMDATGKKEDMKQRIAAFKIAEKNSKSLAKKMSQNRMLINELLG